jgi:two-component system copper resistance phosphate regulon response regulator CusR
MHILVVEDDKPLADFVKKALESEQYAVDLAWNGEDAQSLVAEADFDLVILDLGLPKIGGWEVLIHIRTQKPSLPVLILSGRAEVEDRVKGLDLGADDYLAKPFSLSELSARVRALLRRSPNPVDIVLRVGDLELDRAERVARRAGRRIELTPHEYALLEYLMRNAGRCVTRAMIIEHVWNLSLDSTTTNVVDVYINYLRKKVDQGFESKLIHTVRSVGYQLGGQEEPDATA